MSKFIKHGFPCLYFEHVVHTLNSRSAIHRLTYCAFWPCGTLGWAGLLPRACRAGGVTGTRFVLYHCVTHDHRCRTSARTVLEFAVSVTGWSRALGGEGRAPSEGAGGGRASPLSASAGCWLRPSHLCFASSARSLLRLHTTFSVCLISLSFPLVRIHVTAFRAVI